MCLCNDGKKKERIALSTLFSLLIVPRILSILVNVLFSLGHPAGASAIERELLIRSMKLEFPKEFPPPLLSFFGSRFISRAAKTKNLVPQSIFAPKQHGNTCYAGYLLTLLYL